MTKAEKAILLEILEDAHDHLGSQCCNDFDLKLRMPSLEERDQFVKDYHTFNGDPENTTSSLVDETDYRLPDFGIVYTLIQKLKKEI